ncbi:CLUMA_CG002988, isoform A [Clunio marinus]|uniref:CLUMA_CG002988, isoform A n=1 Tax=Clunio marinus TaxID=568069 RepID=A0A1J1HMF6_9DIPT|nr:CLUMA_CG002988, isoform A [Clunio marinus]
MSIRLQISKNALESENDADVHFIPASIDGNANTKVDEYFNSYKSIENGLQINALRGYPLKGIEIDLPDNMQGLVLRENEKLQMNAERELKFGGKFDKFTYWNYDKNPSENDSYRKAMHWLKVSEALHSEITSLDDVKL